MRDVEKIETRVIPEWGEVTVYRVREYGGGTVDVLKGKRRGVHDVGDLVAMFEQSNADGGCEQVCTVCGCENYVEPDCWWVRSCAGCGLPVMLDGLVAHGCMESQEPWLPGQDGKRCPLRAGATCYRNECAWYMDVGACAVPVLVSKLDKVAEAVRSVDDTLLGYDQRGLLVRARTE